jgi:hypothetical protein
MTIVARNLSAAEQSAGEPAVVSTEPAKVLRLPLRPGSLGGRTLFLRWVVLQAVVATLIAGAAIAYGDQVPAFAAIDFLSCLLVVFVAVALTSSPPQVKTYGDYAVVITWPKGQNDVDLYLRDP